MTHVSFMFSEWENLVKLAKAKYDAMLGKRPTYKAVKSGMTKLKKLTMAQWIGIFLTAPFIMFSSFKLMLQSQPFVDSMIKVLGHGTALDPTIETVMRVTAAIVFFCSAGFAVLFYMLLAVDPEIVRQVNETKNYTGWKKISLDYISPRLPVWLVYMITAWLIYATAAIDGDVFQKIIPILSELGLVHLAISLSDIMAHNHALVTAELDEQVSRWDNRSKNYQRDEVYIELLYQVGRERLSGLTRQDENRRPIKPNIRLVDDAVALYDAFLEEYSDFTVGQDFAIDALNLRKPSGGAPAMLTVGTKRTPPNNAMEWTTDSLAFELERRGITPADYTRPQLDTDYAAGYNARTVFAKIKQAA